MYAQSAPFPVYCHDCFFGHRWDPLQFGRAYDTARPFLEQIQNLLREVPHLSIINKQTENSEYSNYSFANKNCYLTFGSHYEEDCLYGAYSTKNKDCLDCLWLYGSELLYECLFSKNCYRSVFLEHCEDSSECFFSRDLRGCNHCLFCANLHQKSYHIFNQPYSPEDYRRRLAQYQLATHDGMETAKRIFAEEMIARFPVKALYQVQCENCNGNTQSNCKNLYRCFLCADSEDCAYAVHMDNTWSSMDMDYMGYDRSERCYQTIGCQGLFDCIACNACWHGSGLRYCQSCFSCSDCVGCSSLQQQSHCILNRQYDERAYRDLLVAIAKEMTVNGSWGQFFPPALSPFGYNETTAKDWFPLSENEAVRLGYGWNTTEDIVSAPKVIPALQLPQTIEEIPDDVLNWAIVCEATGKPFRIVKKELAFYRAMQLPLPHLHPEERHRRHVLRRHGRTLWSRQCAKCQKSIQTTYSPDRPEIVYCEECYLATAY